MKKIIVILAAIMPSILSAAFTVQIRGGAFVPTDKTLRQIYRRGGFELEGEGNISLSEHSTAFFNVNYFSRQGKSLGLQSTTIINLCPLSIGAKYNMPVAGNVDAYVGLGAVCTLLRLHDQSIYVQQFLQDNGWGMVTKTGLLCTVGESFFIDLYADYYLSRVALHGTRRNIGGLRAGLGLGCRF
jgi:hypothetical protein